ncbi:TMP-TENI-domain-containing protein [Mycena kentingensis (nom. inval.)]|nr:TMP-TENI-domain-containing protein [Mycena kentingensis (nom. inval.)]
MEDQPKQPAVRVVPGAPPKKEQPKSRKRKPKTKADDASNDVLESSTAALTETAPTPADINDGAVAPELVAEPEAPAAPDVDSALKPSPIVDMISKRLKVTSKKIGRISAYAATDIDKLNDDQKATLKTLPALEAVQKELTEVKKAVETHEAQLTVQLAQTRQQAQKKEQECIAAAVAAAETAILGRAFSVFEFLGLRPLLASGQFPLALEHAEGSALFSATEVLLGEPSETKEAIISGLLLGKGSYEGVPYTRFLDITQLALNPVAPPEVVPEPLDSAALDLSAANPPPHGLSSAGSFDFMQASELEPPFEENAEWIERSDATQTPMEETNGHIPSAEPVASAAADETFQSNAAIDWADEDEGGLPSIASLHSKFGTSGSATPVVADELQTNGHVPIATPAATVSAPVEEDDGFTTARGRGRARGFRGGERGGERGGFRGGRGGDRGYRGGERGRGGYRGRGEWRGDGERGRGRGRGRGDRGGHVAAAPAA